MKQLKFSGRGGVLLWAGLLITLVLLLWHASVYTFLTDDAFISFRYARNLADGYGLVFNPGFERVEGYTNFLWVLLLAFFSLLGIPPESVSHVLSLGLTVVLWGLVVGYALRYPPAMERRWLVIVPPLLLASTRSVAVWSTSGLETRLFEVLVVGATLRLLRELSPVAGGESRLWPVSGLLFGLATLARPEGLLISACALGAGAVASFRRRHEVLPRLSLGAGTYVLLVGGHFLFRYLYYGAWLPNTYYAKVAGRSWWEMGLAHHGLLILEYAAYLWVPVIVISVLGHGRRGTGFVPLLFGAVVLPHAIYTASIGGDHFEYRTQDLYFPMAFLLVYDGLRFLPLERFATAVRAAAVGVILIGLVVLPLQSHLQFSDGHIGGFPGTTDQAASSYLEPAGDPLYRLPGLRWLAEMHRSLLWKTTRGFVGIRQEEHVRFLEEVMGEAERLAGLIRTGRIPADTFIAIDSIGAIAHVTDLRVLDRLGLTDSHVARGDEVASDRLLGHDKRATLSYARQQGVDFWALDFVHPSMHTTDPRLHQLLDLAVQQRAPVYIADIGGGFILAGLLPQGPDKAARRFPGLAFRSLARELPRSPKARHTRPELN